jgi:Ni2+-binding GTPase involved in maturation of urease and hydrogenase
MLKRADSQDTRLLLFRDILSMYKKMIGRACNEYGIAADSVIVKDSGKRDINRAPLVVIERGDYQHEPRSLMLNEHSFYNQNTNRFTATTEHVFDYPIEFNCYGNTYLEAERLGSMCVEAILTTGMSIVRRKHPNVLGAELVLWTKTDFAEGQDSSLMTTKVIAKVTMIAHGEYTE